jgi:rhodanese-related sulfurtransferase
MNSIFKNITKNEIGISDVTPVEVFEKLRQIQIIDVRRPDEWTGDLGHIEGAQLMTLDQIPQMISNLQKDQTYVFVCKSGWRSAHAVQFANSQGFSDVYNMQGGMLLWNELGLQIADT